MAITAVYVVAVFMIPYFLYFCHRINKRNIIRKLIDQRTYWCKKGTTWTQELVWTVYHEGNVEAAKTKDQTAKWCFLEYMGLTAAKIKEIGAQKVLEGGDLNRAMHTESPRFLKTHLPISMLPPKLLDTCKVVYVVRNPMDTVVSWYHHACSFKSHGWNGTFQDFFNLFLNDNVLYSPYWNHVKEAWKLRNHPNMCFLFYESLQEVSTIIELVPQKRRTKAKELFTHNSLDLTSNIRKVAAFLGKQVPEEKMDNLRNYLSFDKMKNNPFTNKENLKHVGTLKGNAQFLRKGIIGDWKNHFTEEMEVQMEQWCKKNAEGCGIEFPGIPLWKS